MGNVACTDAVPFTLEEILLSRQAAPARLMELLPETVIENFTRYQHNLKAFMFRQGAATGDAVKRMDSSQVYLQPLDLAQAKIKLTESAVYVLLHVQCTPPAASDSNCHDTVGTRGGERPHRESDGIQCSNEETLLWARVLTDMFTPRGRATAFATNIDKPSFSASPSTGLENAGVGAGDNSYGFTASSGMGGLDFRFSVHILTGNKADQLVASVALLHALRIEQSLMESDEVVRRLFFNYKPSQGISDAKLASLSCMPIGEIVGDRSFSHRSPRIMEECPKNAIFRILHNIRCKTSFPTILPTPFSARGNLSRDSTPRGMFNTTATNNSSSIYQQATMQSRAGVASPSSAQGPPVLEIPRLRFAAEAARQRAVDMPLNAPRQSTAQTPRLTQLEGASSASNATSTRTTTATVGSTLLPVIANLHLNETLNRRCATELSLENDEIRMTEERVKKLRAAAPEATEVLPWLFVGGEEAAGDRNQLLAKGITNVVNTVAFSMGNLHSDIFRYLGLYLSDSPDEPIFSLFPVVIRFVEEARLKGGKTFIHCHQGVSRSCSFVIAYVMWHQGICYDRAFEFVRSKRQVCSPNTGFYVNLLLWENQLSTPVFNKIYAYVPYMEYLFPFSFRLALAFRGSQRSQDDDSQIVNPFVHVVHGTDESYTVDPRLSYGILLGDHGSRSEDRAMPIKSYFFAGSDCDAIVWQEARLDWDAFIKYSFYQGQKKRSTNNKGEVITFTPMPPVEQPTQCLWELRDLGRVINEGVFSQTRRASGGTRYPNVVQGQVQCWNKLLARDDLVFRLSTYLAEEQRVNLTSQSRKRMREEERRRLSKLVSSASTPRLSSYKGGSGRNNAGTSSVVVNAANPTNTTNNTPLTAHTSFSIAAPSSRVAAANTAAMDLLPLVQPLPTPPLVTPATTTTKSAAASAKTSLPRKTKSSIPSTARSNSLGGEVEIYAYPFTGPPLTDILDVADMEPDGCYAVVVPATAAAATTSWRHRVFLWLGRSCSVGEAEAWQTYRRSLKIDKDVRLWNKTLLQSPLEEVAHDGEEPDDLILALE
ncbi:hypothetical protein TcYC6_0076490 [Trypanosoma cruzi]|nr:hypothetical protein TcYC6_0076490 [Trypanosoma cruzi]